jgi:cytochrome b involved in lipid metabolism
VIGGKKILQKFAGRDASKQFRKFHSEAEDILFKYKEELQLGGLKAEVAAEVPLVVETVPELAQTVVANA